MGVAWSYIFITVLAVMFLNPLLLIISERLNLLTPTESFEGYSSGSGVFSPRRSSRRVSPGPSPRDNQYDEDYDEEEEGEQATGWQFQPGQADPVLADEDGEEIAAGLQLDSSWKGPRFGLDAPPTEVGDTAVVVGSLMGRDVVPRSDGARSMVAWKPAVVHHLGQYWSFFTQYNPTYGEPWFMQGWINAAVSTDMDTWHMRGTALPALPKPDWLSGRMLSASALSHDGNLYLYYSAASMGEPKVERIGLAVLKGNATVWERVPLKAVKTPEGYQRQVVPLVEPDSQWYDDAASIELRPQHPRYRGHVQWRDPYVVGPVRKHFYMFVSASCAELSSPWRGCVALASAKQPAGPWEVGEPALLPVLPEADRIMGGMESMFYETERPSVFEHHGKWHMFVSSPIINRNPRWRSAKLVQNRGARLFHFVADRVQGPYEPFQNEVFPQVQDAARTGMYGVMVVPAPAEEQQASKGEAGKSLLVIGGYDVRKHPGGKAIRHEMHGTMEVSHRYRLDWPDPHHRPVVAGRVPFGWKIDTYDMESGR